MTPYDTYAAGLMDSARHVTTCPPRNPPHARHVTTCPPRHPPHARHVISCPPRHPPHARHVTTYLPRHIHLSLTTGRHSLDNKPKISGMYVPGTGRHSSHNSTQDLVAAVDVAAAGAGAGRQSATDVDLDLAQMGLEVGVDMTDGGMKV